MIDTIKPLIKQFLPFAQERMGFQDPPRLFIREDDQNAQNPLGKTAFYDPSAKSVTVYVTGRHPKDVMRSLSHELVHHTQNCNGEFENVGQMGDGYAQNDAHLREMERQAYEIGNLCFRDWEDSIKHTIYFEHLQKGVETIMSTKDWKNNEMSDLLTEKWGFRFDLTKLSEEKSLNEARTGSGKGHGPGDRGGKTAEAYIGGKKSAKSKRSELKEDSGEDEAWHDWKNEHADDDHIREMEHHLRALKDDRDYERKDAEYDHDDYEDDRLHEGKKSKKKSKKKNPYGGQGGDETAAQRKGGYGRGPKDRGDSTEEEHAYSKRLKEDSGEDEAWHDWMNEHADDDHILELAHHLRALKEDRDEDAEHADYGDDEYLTSDEEADDMEFAAEEEDEELEENCGPMPDEDVIVMQSSEEGEEMGDEGPSDPAALADELVNIAQQLATSLQGGEMEDDMETMEEGGMADREEEHRMKPGRGRRSKSSLKEDKIRAAIRAAIRNSLASK